MGLPSVDCRWRREAPGRAAPGWGDGRKRGLSHGARHLFFDSYDVLDILYIRHTIKLAIREEGASSLAGRKPSKLGNLACQDRCLLPHDAIIWRGS